MSVYWQDEHTETLPNGVVVTVAISPEDISPEGQFASGDDDADKEMVADIYRRLEQDLWAWCCVRVRATYAGFQGEDYLHGCACFGGVKEFMQPGSYFDDMRDAAIADLMSTLEREAQPNPSAVLALQTLKGAK